MKPLIKKYFDILNGEDTKIYFEEEHQIYNSDNNSDDNSDDNRDDNSDDNRDNNSDNSSDRRKYVLFLMSIRPALIYKLLCYFILMIYILISLVVIFPRHMESLIPVFIVNDEKFKNIFENMRKKKLAVFAIMFLSYNVIYGLLCNTNIIHIYQNGRLIYNDYYVDNLFIKSLENNLINIKK
ncbi:selenoprotein [Plasmodium yoelii yoelii]|uniref:Selenoprotein n=1 Tax=Plasmodium yoelii yoelii TaxID=73239 RepID=A0AAE9WQ11_PLAYO|nr:selenoprotein [Plasmodium yoelii yoelii]